VEKLQSGTELKRLVAAAALANARTFGGEDYVGFHTMMALAPAYHMAKDLPAESAPLPVLKVLYRNSNRISQVGGRKNETLHPVEPSEGVATGAKGAEALRDAVRAKDMDRAEKIFAALAGHGPDEAFNDVLYAVHDHTEVHRVVLPYRAWDLMDLIGREHAHALLRQSVRYCVKAEGWNNTYTEYDQPRTLLPKMLEQHHLLGREPGTKVADDKWVEDLAKTIFSSPPEQAAGAAAAALEEGFAPSCVGEAISLAANQLVLRDHGRPAEAEVAGKPMGSVHGDSIGVHACDSANAWRNMARAANARNAYACLILGAYQVALDRIQRGGDFLNWQPLPLPQHVAQVRSTDPTSLLQDLDEAIRGNLQAHAAAVVQRYGDLGHEPRKAFGNASVSTKPAGFAPLAARSDRLTRSAFFAIASGGSLGKKCTPPTMASAVTTKARPAGGVRSAASSVKPSAPGCRAIGLKCRAISRSSADSCPDSPRLARSATASPHSRFELARAQLPCKLVEHRIDHAGLLAIDEGIGDIDIFAHHHARRHVGLAVEFVGAGAQDRA